LLLTKVSLLLTKKRDLGILYSNKNRIDKVIYNSSILLGIILLRKGLEPIVLNKVRYSLLKKPIIVVIIIDSKESYSLGASILLI
jgi:hypothetical protein